MQNFSDKFCNPNKIGFIGMDTDSLYLAISQSNLEGIIKPEMKSTWESDWEKNDCTISFEVDNLINFFARLCCEEHKNLINAHNIFKEKFSCTKKIVLRSQTYCCFSEASSTKN